MKKSEKTIIFFSLLLFMLVVEKIYAQDPSAERNDVLYHYSGILLKDSKWGKLTDFQKALSEKLGQCGQPSIDADGKFGNQTRSGLINLMECQDFADFRVPSNSPFYGAVYTSLWRKLLPDSSLPTVHERTFVLTLSHEGTDYDKAEWNYGTSDDKSALTWGPYGATAGWGNEIRGVFKRIEEVNPGLLQTLFSEEFAKVSELMEKDQNLGYEVLKPVWLNRMRRAIWKQKIAELGAEKTARDAYEWYAFQSNQWFKPGIRRLYRLIPEAQSNATEVDYAFFLDLAVHMSITERRLEKAKQAIASKESALGRRLKSAERRQAISLNMIPSAQQQDRLGRNVVYYVDGVGIEGLSANEKNAWQTRSKLRASNCGLVDTRNYFPEFLN